MTSKHIARKGQPFHYPSLRTVIQSFLQYSRKKKKKLHVEKETYMQKKKLTITLAKLRVLNFLICIFTFVKIYVSVQLQVADMEHSFIPSKLILLCDQLIRKALKIQIVYNQNCYILKFNFSIKSRDSFTSKHLSHTPLN